MLILGKAWIGWLPSSTAQGGGGSFKDRKPIGDVSCCDEANPLMERRVAEDLSFSFSLFASCLSLSNCLYLSIYYVSGHVSIYLNICLSVCLSVCLAGCLSVYLSICPSVYLSSTYLYIRLWKFQSIFTCFTCHRPMQLMIESFSWFPPPYRHEGAHRA